MNKCYFCEQQGIKEVKVPVDIDADCDIDPDTGQEIWYSHPIYSKEWVCIDHLNEYEEKGYIGKE